VSPPADSPTLLQAIGLTKEYRQRGAAAKAVIRGVDLSIPRGDVYGLMGLTGAGKSTLVGMLSGLLNPSSGEVRINGEPHGPEQLREHVALALGVDGGFYKKLSLLDNLVFAGMLQGLTRLAAATRSAEVIEMVGLTTAADRAYSRFSSGMRRQAHLARALLVPRPLLIADEPTRGLDPATEERIVRLLRKIKEQGQTMLVVTHDVHLASSLCDWVGILESGELVREGHPDELIHLLSSHRIYLRFHERPVKVKRRLEAMEQLTELHSHGNELHVYTTDPENDINLVLRILVDCGVPLAHIAVPEPSLEEVFMKVIAERKHQAAEAKSAATQHVVAEAQAQGEQQAEKRSAEAAP